MKKVALIHYAFPPYLGGVEFVVQHQSVLLKSEGFDVRVLVGAGEQSHPNIPVTQIPEFQSIMSFNPSLQNKILTQGIIDEEFFALKKSISRKLEENLHSCDIIIVHNMLTTHLNLAFMAAFHDYAQKNPAKKYIIWVHDHNYISEEKIKEIDKLHVSDYEHSLLTTVIPNANYVVISHTFNELLKKVLPLSPEQTNIIPNGIDIYQFLEIEPAIKDFAHKYRLESAFPIIMSPVNILERKNLEYSIDTIRFLKKVYPSICYIITGQPSQHRNTHAYLDSLKQRIKKHGLEKEIVFLSNNIERALQPSELHDIYSLSDLIFYFSRSENFGIPILEALATKTPIFTSFLNVFKEVGNSYINSIDTEKVTPEQTSIIVNEYIDKHPQIQGAFEVRNTFNLKTIVTQKLLPLLNE